MAQTTPQPRYIGTDPLQKQFASAVRRNVNAYFKENNISTKADIRLVPKTIALLVMYFGPLVLLVTMPMSAWWLVPLNIIMGIGLAGIGMSMMHDGVHGAVSNKQWLNKAMGSCMVLLGSTVFTWKILHNVNHHTHTNVDEHDQDIDPPAILRFSDHAPLKPIHRIQHVLAWFLYGLLTVTKIINDYFTLARFSKQGITKQHGINVPWEFVSMTITKILVIFMFIGLPLLLTDLSWWQVLLGFALMHFVAGLIMGSVFQLAHVVEGTEQPIPNSEGIIEADWAVHEMRTTANFAPRNRLVNWYVGGLNYQVEHHLFPHISHLHYSAIAPIVERTAREHNVPYTCKPTLRAALRSHFRRLYQLGHEEHPA